MLSDRSESLFLAFIWIRLFRKNRKKSTFTACTFITCPVDGVRDRILPTEVLLDGRDLFSHQRLSYEERPLSIRYIMFVCILITEIFHCAKMLSIVVIEKKCSEMAEGEDRQQITSYCRSSTSCSSLKAKKRSFRYASAGLGNQLLDELREPLDYLSLSLTSDNKHTHTSSSSSSPRSPSFSFPLPSQNLPLP